MRHLLRLSLLAALTAAAAQPAPAGTPTGSLDPLDNANYWNSGRALAASGNYVIAGALGAKVQLDLLGAAYVFDATTGQQLHKLEANDGEHLDWFGGAVDCSGNLAVIGAPFVDDLGTDSGAIYVFDLTTGQQLHKLYGSNTTAGDYFGVAVGISGNIIIAGASHADTDGTDSGTAYFFDATTGAQIAQWLRGNGQEGDYFGRSVAIDGFKALAGAPYHHAAEEGSGSVYVYDLILGLSQGRLNRIDGTEWDRFGWSVDLDAGVAIVGSMYDDHNGDSAGSAYLFDVGTGLQLHKMLPDDPDTYELFGSDVAIRGNTALVGCRWDRTGNVTHGAAYVFDVISGQQVDKLIDPSGGNNDEFGFMVAFNGATALVGAYKDDDSGTDSGSIFEFDTCPDTLQLGASPAVAQQGDTLAITTTGGMPGAAGALYYVDVNGIPVINLINTGTFDTECKRYLVSTVPAGLSGFTVTFLALGFTATGLQFSNLETVAFQ